MPAPVPDPAASALDSSTTSAAVVRGARARRRPTRAKPKTTASAGARTCTSPHALEQDAGNGAAAGWRTVLPACLAVIPLGLAFGVLVVQSGLEWWWAPAFAAFIFAGSLEFLLVGLIAAAAPLAQIAVSALLVNFRHVFYALTFPLHRVQGLGWKAYSTFALTDEAYALTATPDAANWSRARILTIQAGFHAAWVASVALGAALGTLIPPEVQGLDFAVTALFVVLGMDAYRLRRSVPVALVAVACAVAAAFLMPEDMLLVAMALFTAALVASYFATRRWRGDAAAARAATTAATAPATTAAAGTAAEEESA